MKELIFPPHICTEKTALIHQATEQAYNNLNELAPLYSAALTFGTCSVVNCKFTCEVRISRLKPEIVYSKITTNGQCIMKEDQ